jgi:hypothetical protein
MAGMKPFLVRTWVLPLGLLLFIGMAGAAGAASLQAGFATVDITPPIGGRMSGYFSERLSTETHDPLLAKAVVLEQERARVALVFCDLIGIEGGLATTARQRASQRTGIPAANILICATHSHTGPLYHGALRQQLHEATVAKFGEDIYERVDYRDTLAERLADVVARAYRSRRPVTLETGQTAQPGLAFNRRFHMQDGTVVFNPGKTNANIVRAAGPVDPAVGLALFRDRAGRKPQAAITAFALHCDTVGGTQYSGDYPHYLEVELRRQLGADFLSCFGNGPCGDINHIDVSHGRPQKGHEEAQRIGTALGQTVLAAMPTLKEAKPDLAALGTKIFVRLQTNTAAEIVVAREKMPLVGGKKLKFLEEVEVCRIADLALMNQTSRALEVQTFRLSSDTAIVGLPGEVFTELGMAIKARSPFQHTLVIELCNDCIAYVPTQRAFVEGSYEIVNSRVAPGGGELLVETAVKLLRELKGK